MLAIRKAIADKLAEQGHKMPLYNGPIVLGLVFRFPVPATASRAVRYASHNTLRPKRPDLDNLEKQFCDAMNGVLWADDSQVCAKFSCKVSDVGKEGSTSVYVRERASDAGFDFRLEVESVAEFLPFEDVVLPPLPPKESKKKPSRA